MSRFSVLCAAAALTVVSLPAAAGNLNFTNGQSQWQSTRCEEPMTPPPLLSVGSEAPAGDLNMLMESYNFYATQVQQYMNCVSAEAQSDAEMASSVITQSAQATISEAQYKVGALHDALQARQ